MNKKTLSEKPWLSLSCLTGILFQLLAVGLLNLFPDDIGIFSNIMMFIFLFAPVAGIFGLIIGIIQLRKTTNKKLPLLGIILNSLWILVILFFFVIFQEAMSVI